MSVVLPAMATLLVMFAATGTAETPEALAMPPAPEALTIAHHAILDQNNWIEQVGSGLGVWVSVDEQVLRIIENGTVLWQAPCSTAANGTGSQSGSNKTPLGWHRVAEKFGDGAPEGQEFVARQPTRTVWKPGDDTEKDMVLTRILWLDGLEPGRNKGGEVDSYLRYIYIHGTNGEEKIGTPASHGCVRLGNRDAIEAFERIPLEARVLITETEPQR